MRGGGSRGDFGRLVWLLVGVELLMHKWEWGVGAGAGS
jgi:hypothetical protein